MLQEASPLQGLPEAQKIEEKGIATVNWKIWPIFKSPPAGYLQTFR
jgi:hypothetical protein